MYTRNLACVGGSNLNSSPARPRETRPDRPKMRPILARLRRPQRARPGRIFGSVPSVKKAFDSVWRIGLWRAMRFLGYEDKLVRLLEALYKDTMSAVRVDRDCHSGLKLLLESCSDVCCHPYCSTYYWTRSIQLAADSA